MKHNKISRKTAVQLEKGMLEHLMVYKSDSSIEGEEII